MAEIKTYQLKLYETGDVFPMKTRPAGIYRRDLRPEGNSLLSSVHVCSADPGVTVTVKYYQTTTGQGCGEKQFLEEHTALTTADATLVTDSIIITKIHNKPFFEVEITGGSAEVGIYVTVISQFASDIDASLKKENQSANLTIDKGLVTMCYDPDSGTYHFIRCVDGAIAVTPEDPGTPFYLDAEVDSDPGNSVDVFSFVVPGGITRRLKNLNVVTVSPGCYSLYVDGDEIARGIMHETRKNLTFTFDPPRAIASGQTVVLKYIADSQPTYVCPVKGFISATDI